MSACVCGVVPADVQAVYIPSCLPGSLTPGVSRLALPAGGEDVGAGRKG